MLTTALTYRKCFGVLLSCLLATYMAWLSICRPLLQLRFPASLHLSQLYSTIIQPLNFNDYSPPTSSFHLSPCKEDSALDFTPACLLLSKVSELLQLNCSDSILCFTYHCTVDHCLQVRSRATTFIVEFLERFTVENPQQLPVTIYDYYDPGKHVSL